MIMIELALNRPKSIRASIATESASLLPIASRPNSVVIFFNRTFRGPRQILLFIGVVEGWSYPGDFWSGEGEREAGDLGLYLKKP